MIKSQFNYCPLVWMFCSRQCNNLINKIHEQSLWISCETHNLTIHQRNMQVLITEVYKIVSRVASQIMNSLFEFRDNEYNIKKFQVLSIDIRKTVNYAIKTVTYRASPLWAKLPSECKLAASLEEFKVNNKKLKYNTSTKSWIC